MPFRDPVQPPPLSDVREAFQEAAEYVYSLGVSRKNVRLKAYNDFLNTISLETQEFFVPDEAMRLWREIHELTFVLSVFKDNNLTPPNDLLKKSLDGKPLEEYESETGRNFFLELRAAIYFLRIGYAITLDQDCDIVAVRNRQRIFIECKRLYSEKKAGRRVRECYEQLETRLAAADRSYNNLGLAWVDPSAAMQKYYFLYTAYSEAGARDAARADLVYFWRKWIANTYNGREKRIFALVLQMVWPSWVARSQGIRTGFTSYVLLGHRKTGFFGLFRARKLLDEIMSIEEA
jgi:hypothetical protein